MLALLVSLALSVSLVGGSSDADGVVCSILFVPKRGISVAAAAAASEVSDQKIYFVKRGARYCRVRIIQVLLACCLTKYVCINY